MVDREGRGEGRCICGVAQRVVEVKGKVFVVCEGVCVYFAVELKQKGWEKFGSLEQHGSPLAQKRNLVNP
jgi:hypothetical protein